MVIIMLLVSKVRNCSKFLNFLYFMFDIINKLTVLPYDDNL